MDDSETQGTLVIIAAVAAMATGDAFIKFFADTVPLPFKGDARDYSNGKHNDAVWSDEQPLEAMEAIAGKLSSQADSPVNAVGAIMRVMQIGI